MSVSLTGSFTRTGAEYLASKIAAELQAMSDYYGSPDEAKIPRYQKEMAELLSEGCVEWVQYGFRRDGKKVFVLKYRVQPSGFQDGRSGGVLARVDVSGAEWFSFMTYTRKWHSLSDARRREIKDRTGIKRAEGEEPADGDGCWAEYRDYSSEGVGVQRGIFRPGGPQ